MITHERLKELIEKKETIYELDINLNIYTLDLIDYQNVKMEEVDKYSLAKLFETREEAEWHKEFKRIPRTDYLDLPTWEEIQYDKDWFVLKFHIKDNYDGFGKIIILKDHSIHLQSVSLGVLHQEYFDEPATKENYLLACRKAKELFLGKKE